jgi:hypothetical protein
VSVIRQSATSRDARIVVRDSRKRHVQAG